LSVDAVARVAGDGEGGGARRTGSEAAGSWEGSGETCWQRDASSLQNKFLYLDCNSGSEQDHVARTCLGK
jgi:hypothetical protein